MKKINFLITAIVLFITCFDCANALVTTQQANNMRKAYQTFRGKLRTCSPYTYNVDGDPAIVRIEGIYNRRCLVRFLGYNNTVECNFKNDSLRKYISSIPSFGESMKSLEEIANTKDKEADKLTDSRITFFLGDINTTSPGICKSNNTENQNNNNAQ